MSPERLVNARKRAGQDRAAAIEGVAIDSLPVMCDGARVFANQVRLDLFNRCLASERAAFGDWLAQAVDTGVRMHFQKEPARFDEKRFESGDLDAFADGRARRLLDSLARRDDLFGVGFITSHSSHRAQPNRCGGVFK
jgi:hypothetical protein